MEKPVFAAASVTPLEILAGDSVELRVSLTLGGGFSAEGTRLVFDLPAFLGYARPSVQHQEDSGYVEFFCSNPDILYRKRNWDIEIGDFPTRDRQSFRGMAQRFVVIDFIGGPPREGDLLEFVWGHTRDGFGCGVKVASIVPRRVFTNTIHVRYFLDAARALPDFARSYKGYERPAPDVEIPLSYRILPREPERVRLVRGQRKSLALLLDRFSNNNPFPEPGDIFENPEGLVRNEDGVLESKDVSIRLRPKSLPLQETPDMRGVFEGCGIYFGDLHTHSSISNDCIEREKQDMGPSDMFRFARLQCNLDFLAVTDHHQPWDIERNKIGEANWSLLMDAVRRHDRPGEFLALAGFEFRCDGHPGGRGDTAVVLAEEFGYGEIDDPSMHFITNLWDKFRGRDYITIPHFHAPGSLPAGEWWACPYEGVETLLEIFSCHGSYESSSPLEQAPPESKQRRPDRTGLFLLRDKRLRYGLTCNSDGHKGNPGTNGLTAVYAKELTRGALFDALRRRRVYGTTNARIRLLFTANGALMGSELPAASDILFHISVAGERPFKAVDLLHNGDLHTRLRPGAASFAADIRVADAAPGFWYVRATQVDNHIAYASPIWFG